MQERGYQTEARAAIWARLVDENQRSTLLVLPTGCGKTIVFAKVAEMFRRRGRVLVLAHREELLTQAAEKIEGTTSLRTAIEAAERRADLDGEEPPDVVI